MTKPGKFVRMTGGLIRRDAVVAVRVRAAAKHFTAAERKRRVEAGEPLVEPNYIETFAVDAGGTEHQLAPADFKTSVETALARALAALGWTDADVLTVGGLAVLRAAVWRLAPSGRAVSAGFGASTEAVTQRFEDDAAAVSAVDAVAAYLSDPRRSQTRLDAEIGAIAEASTRRRIEAARKTAEELLKQRLAAERRRLRELKDPAAVAEARHRARLQEYDRLHGEQVEAARKLRAADHAATRATVDVQADRVAEIEAELKSLRGSGPDAE